MDRLSPDEAVELVKEVVEDILKYSPDQLRDDNDRWTGDMGTGLAREARVKGGYSYNVITGKPPKTGFMVSNHKDREKPIDGLPSSGIIKQYLKDNEDLLTQLGNFAGAWSSGGKTVLDVSINVPDCRTAEKLRVEHHQEKYWDVVNRKEGEGNGN